MFGIGLLAHLLRHGRRYEVVHTCSFPYFSLLAAAAVRPLARYGLVVDWFEVWSPAYWREYLGGAAGRVGLLVQRLCARVPQRAFCFSELHAARLREEGLHGEVTVLRGLYAEQHEPPSPRPADPLVLFAGRLIREKRPPWALPRWLGRRARSRGCGASSSATARSARRSTRRSPSRACEEIVSAPGFADADTVDREMRRALCVLLPSRREGYGMVVVEAAARGTPSVRAGRRRQRGHRADRGGRQRDDRGRRGRGLAGRRDRPRGRGRHRRCARAPRRGSRPTPSGCR